jgi:7,8-dihydropterin-6-yl-methyl-4-(beta-D-ribofuranosyl)aminobenzene 5'-phosphate synthase
MKITIIYDNEVWKEGLRADWGFSSLIEAYGRRILFDTGANGSILMDNMKKLGIDPLSIDDVFISHAHLDHTGGLSAFLKQNSNVTLWVPPSFGRPIGAKEIIVVKGPMQLYEDIYSTGELESIEQSLCIKTTKGIIVITGCSHPKMEHILRTASQFGKVYGILGGLHGTEPKSLKNLDFICPLHCTQYKREIKSLYPKQYIEGGAGKVIEIK